VHGFLRARHYDVVFSMAKLWYTSASRACSPGGRRRPRARSSSPRLSPPRKAALMPACFDPAEWIGEILLFYAATQLAYALNSWRFPRDKLLA